MSKTSRSTSGRRQVPSALSREKERQALLACLLAPARRSLLPGRAAHFAPASTWAAATAALCVRILVRPLAAVGSCHQPCQPRPPRSPLLHAHWRSFHVPGGICWSSIISRASLAYVHPPSASFSFLPLYGARFKFDAAVPKALLLCRQVYASVCRQPLLIVVSA